MELRPRFSIEPRYGLHYFRLLTKSIGGVIVRLWSSLGPRPPRLAQSLLRSNTVKITDASLSSGKAEQAYENLLDRANECQDYHHPLHAQAVLQADLHPWLGAPAVAF